jgi:hypothetical protein
MVEAKAKSATPCRRMRNSLVCFPAIREEEVYTLMLILPFVRSRTRSANFVAPSPHGNLGPTTTLNLYSRL